MDKKSKQNDVQSSDVLKLYQRPQTLSREPLEAIAGACGVPPTGKDNNTLCGNGTNQS